MDRSVRQSRKPRHLTVAILASSAAVVFLLLAFGAYFLITTAWDLRRVAARAEGAVATYRAAGLPWEAKDMEPQPPVTDGENAAPMFLQAMRALEGRAFNTATGNVAAPARAGHLAEVQSLLKPYDSAMRLAARAATRPKLEFK